MQKLTFKGFLSEYVYELSENNTRSIRKLVEEANSGNYRLREPLILWCIISDKTKDLIQYSKGTEIEAIYHTFWDLKSDDINALLQGSQLPPEFKKVWNSYQVRANRHGTDDETKEYVRRKILEIKLNKNISNYRIYTDLKLNPGNLNAWLKNGKEDLISLNNAKRVLDYLEGSDPLC